MTYFDEWVAKGGHHVTAMISHRLRDLRSEHGLTQKQAAALVHTSERNWQRYEYNVVPSNSILELFCLKLGLNYQETIVDYFSRCCDPRSVNCNEPPVIGIYSEPICQDCFDGLHDCQECCCPIAEQDEQALLEYCAECAQRLGVEQ